MICRRTPTTRSPDIYNAGASSAGSVPAYFARAHRPHILSIFTMHNAGASSMGFAPATLPERTGHTSSQYLPYLGFLNGACPGVFCRSPPATHPLDIYNAWASSVGSVPAYFAGARRPHILSIFIMLGLPQWGPSRRTLPEHTDHTSARYLQCLGFLSGVFQGGPSRRTLPEPTLEIVKVLTNNTQRPATNQGTTTNNRQPTTNQQTTNNQQ